mgnify:CR=1 FL=1
MVNVTRLDGMREVHLVKAKVLKSFATLIILGGIVLWGANFTFPEGDVSKPDRESVDTKTLVESLMDDETPNKSEIRTELFNGQSVPREEAFMEALHKMTHQKVYATPKWGVLEITEERLNEMLQVVKESHYDQENFYLETLETWLQGDFSNAVEVHNYIWTLQEGTVGEAERLLDPDEEAEYIEQYLR